jgi:hypothetical protein
MRTVPIKGKGKVIENQCWVWQSWASTPESASILNIRVKVLVHVQDFA